MNKTKKCKFMDKKSDIKFSAVQCAWSPASRRDVNHEVGRRNKFAIANFASMRWRALKMSVGIMIVVLVSFLMASVSIMLYFPFNSMTIASRMEVPEVPGPVRIHAARPWGVLNESQLKAPM